MVMIAHLQQTEMYRFKCKVGLKNSSQKTCRDRTQTGSDQVSDLNKNGNYSRARHKQKWPLLIRSAIQVDPV